MYPTMDNPMVYDLDGTADIQNILKQIDPLVLMKKIAEFRRLNISGMSSAEIDKAILDVLCWNGMFCCYTNIKSYPAGTKFFRVKRFKGSKVPDERFKEYQDFWETDPKHLKDYGRLNKPGESLLYVTPDLHCAIDECRIKEDEFFAAILYTAKTDIKVNMIGGEFDYPQMGIVDEKVKLIHEIYNGFLRDEFSRDVGKGTEFLYRTSEAIAKSYFDLPPRVVQDAWAYASIQDKKKYNVCFRPDIAHEVLELNGAMICRVNEAKEVKVYCVAVGVDENNNILFYPVGSEPQKRVFPEITTGV